MNINLTPKISLFALLSAVVVTILTIIFLGKPVGMMFACIVFIIGGLATFLKSKKTVLKIAGMVFFGIGLFWLLIASSLLSSIVGG